MQIFTLDDAEFPEILAAWKGAEDVGRFWKNGNLRTIRASSQFVIISPDDSLAKFAAKPTKNLHESLEIARQLLIREEKRGNRIENLQ